MNFHTSFNIPENSKEMCSKNVSKQIVLQGNSAAMECSYGVLQTLCVLRKNRVLTKGFPWELRRFCNGLRSCREASFIGACIGRHARDALVGALMCAVRTPLVGGDGEGVWRGCETKGRLITSSSNMLNLIRGKIARGPCGRACLPPCQAASKITPLDRKYRVRGCE